MLTECARKLDSKTASFYYSRPSEWLGGRRAVVPCAHILGGGSSINFMVSDSHDVSFDIADLCCIDVHSCFGI